MNLKDISVFLVLIAALLLFLLCVIYIAGINWKPLPKLFSIIILIIAFHGFHILFMGDFLYNTFQNSAELSFGISESYIAKARKKAEKALWISKDPKSDFYIPNWTVLDALETFTDKEHLGYYYKSFRKHFGTELNYESLRNQVIPNYPNLKIALKINLPISTDKTSGAIDDFPELNPFLSRVQAKLEMAGVNVGNALSNEELKKAVSIPFFEIYANSSGNFIAISHFNLLVEMKAKQISEQIKRAIGLQLNVRPDVVDQLVEKALFFFLSYRMFVDTRSVQPHLDRNDFRHLSLSLLAPFGSRDIAPLDNSLRIISVWQSIVGYFLWAVLVAFLVNLILNVNLADLRNWLYPLLIVVGISLPLAGIIGVINSKLAERENKKILSQKDAFTYNIQRDGTVFYKILFGKHSLIGEEKNYAYLSMPYQSKRGIGVRFSGVMITKSKTKIVWAEISPFYNNRIAIYGDNLRFDDIEEDYRILIPIYYVAF